MSTVLFCFLFFLIPLFAYRLLRWSGIRLLSISVPSIFFVYYLLIAYLGILPTFFGWTLYNDIYPELNDGPLLLRAAFYSGSSILLICFGFLLASRMRGSRKAASWAPPLPLNPRVLSILFFLVLACAGVTALYLKQFSGSVLSEALSGEVVSVKILRSEMTNEFKGMGRYTAFYSSLLPFCVFVLLSHSLLARRISAWLLALSALGFTIYSSIITAEKAPLIYLLLGCFLVYAHTRRGRIRITALLPFTILIITALVSLVNLFIGGERPFLDTIDFVFSRIFLGPFIPSFYYLKMFPDSHEFLWGTSLPNPRNIFPWEHYRLTVNVMEFMKGGVGSAEIMGSAPTTYWAEIYANFGPLAPLFVAPLIGFAIYALHIFLGRLHESPVKSGLIVWMAIHFMRLAESSISGYLLDTDLFLVLLAAGLLLVADGQIRLKMGLEKMRSHYHDENAIL